jgi:AcrR family transcriptional regulator
MATIDDSLLEAGRRALRRYGWRALTVERIAAEAGISRATLHRRQVRKDDILAALVEHATAAYREALWPALTGEGSGRERLEQALRALCDSAEDNLELLVALRSQTDAIFHEDEPGEVMTRTEFSKPLERLLRDGIADGTIRDLDPVETATLLFNLVGWTYIHMRTGHRWAPDHARELTVDVALNGVAGSR